MRRIPAWARRRTPRPVAEEPTRADTPSIFHATSGTSQVDRARDPWMPHDRRPTVGFTPNPGELFLSKGTE